MWLSLKLIGRIRSGDHGVDVRSERTDRDLKRQREPSCLRPDGAERRRTGKRSVGRIAYSNLGAEAVNLEGSDTPKNERRSFGDERKDS